MGSQPSSTILTECKKERPNITKILEMIRKGYPIDEINEYKKTPLMYACINDNELIATILIMRGANVNAIDNRGNSVLHIAILRSPGIVKKLIRYGADVNYYSEVAKKTALDYARVFIWYNVYTTIKNAGGISYQDINQFNNNCTTPNNKHVELKEKATISLYRVAKTCVMCRKQTIDNRLFYNEETCPICCTEKEKIIITECGHIISCVECFGKLT